MIALVVNALYNIVDQIFIGWGGRISRQRCDEYRIPDHHYCIGFAVLVGDGGAAYLSLKLGEGDSESVKKGLGNAIVMVTALGVLILIIFLALMNPILALFGATDALLPYAQDYGYIIAIGLSFTMISTALNAMIRVDGSPKYAMLSMLLGAVINVIFDPIFIFVFKMGVGGAAIATVMGQVVSFIVSVVYIPRFKTLHFELSSLRLSGKVCGNILALGVSSFITQIAITIVMVLFNNLLKQYGAESVYGSEIPITTMGIAMKVNQIMLSILVGIAVGAQPVIGYNYGSKNFTRVKKAFLIAIIAAEVVAVICFFVFRFAPMSVVSLFGSEEGLYNEFAVKCFRIFLMLCPLNGFQTVAAIFLQAIGKPVKSAIVTLSRQIVFLIPVAVVLPIYMGVTGVLWAGPVADGLAFILAFILIGFEIKKLNHMPAAAELNSENPQENAQGNTQENTVQITSENAKEELGKSLQEVSYEEQSHHDQP